VFRSYSWLYQIKIKNPNATSQQYEMKKNIGNALVSIFKVIGKSNELEFLGDYFTGVALSQTAHDTV